MTESMTPGQVGDFILNLLEQKGPMTREELLMLCAAKRIDAEQAVHWVDQFVAGKWVMTVQPPQMLALSPKGRQVMGL